MLTIKQVVILAEYFDYTIVFSKKLAIKLLKYLNIKNYIFKLKLDKQLFYRLIYSLKLLELKTFKIYIKSNLINNFIQSPKILIKAPILFI